MKSLLTLIILLAITYCNAQGIFTVRKKSFHHDYLQNEYIKFKTNDKRKVKGRIETLYFDSIEVNGINYSLKNIRKIYVPRENFNFLSAGANIMIAGVGLPCLVMFNSLINDDKELLPQRYWIISPSLMLLGGTFCLLATKRIKVKGLTKIYVM